MTLTHGMDTVAGAAAGSEIDAGSQRIAALARELDAAVHGFTWTGRDADTARDTWDSSSRPTLDAASAHLAELAVLLRREAQAQDDASGPSTGPGTASTGTTPGTNPGTATAGPPPEGGRLAAVVAGLARTLEHAGGFADKVGDLLTGEEDWSVVEVAASAVATAGAGLGTVVNAVTGEDERWFAEGPGIAGPPVPAGGDHPLVPPRDLGSLMDGVTAGYDVGGAPGATGDVRITRIDNPGSPATYVVAVPGTDRWGPDATSVLRDLTANVAMVAAEPTAAVESVSRAMDAAGVPAGARVVLVGHSQGGIVAGMLASDPAFTGRYDVGHLLTYGAPIDHLQLQPGVDALQVQHSGDVVPRIDVGGLATGPDAYPNTPVTTVDLDGPGGGPGPEHDYRTYADSVRASDDPALRGFADRIAPWLLQPGGSAGAVDVPVRRGP